MKVSIKISGNYFVNNYRIRPSISQENILGDENKFISGGLIKDFCKYFVKILQCAKMIELIRQT